MVSPPSDVGIQPQIPGAVDRRAPDRSPGSESALVWLSHPGVAQSTEDSHGLDLVC